MLKAFGRFQSYDDPECIRRHNEPILEVTSKDVIDRVAKLAKFQHKINVPRYFVRRKENAKGRLRSHHQASRARITYYSPIKHIQ